MINSEKKTQILLPNFFIIGAPKSGTTALSEYLRQHPDVLFSKPKEPSFFNTDFSYRLVNNFEDYKKCFSHGTGYENAIGEGSVFYLYSSVAVQNLQKFCPDARIIVMLRDPVEAAYSFHWQTLYSHEENIIDFEKAWEAQEERKQGERIPPHNRVREVLQYGLFFSYANQLERLYRTVSSNQIFIIIYDDFVKYPEAIYQETLRFLSLRSYKLANFARINASKKIRWPAIEASVRLGGKLRKGIGLRKGFGILSKIRELNTRYQERPPLKPSFRAELIEYFRDDVKKTSELIGRDLSEWASV